MISKPLLKFLIICFWASIALMALQIIVFFRAISLYYSGIETEPSFMLQGVYGMLTTLWFLLFIYVVYFFYKYDRYSKSGIYLLVFNLFYALIYFYQVIWQQKRELIGTYEREPVLGNTIYLETEEEDEEDQ